MRHLPNEYKGLTIVLSNPSRFDKHHLLSAVAGHFFCNECLDSSVSPSSSCDIRTSDTIGEGLLPNTRGLLLLGDRAFREWSKEESHYSIGEKRGTPLKHSFGNEITAICSYTPQDCLDTKDYESTHNPILIEEAKLRDDLGEDEDESEGDSKKHGKTRRSNWRFWLTRDTRKILDRIKGGKTCCQRTFKPSLYPNLDEVISILRSSKGQCLHLDIETTTEWPQNLLCIGFNFTDSDIYYCIPIFRYNGSLTYGSLSRFFRALSIAIRDNTVVYHNGFAFDSLLLALRYKIPPGKNNYDTMLAHHRCFPEAEKSLGHCISLWTWEAYHKDEGIFSPQTLEQEKQLWNYNARDVYTMRLVKEAIDSYAPTIPGLVNSIESGNKMIYPYVLNSLTGLTFDEDKREAARKYNDRVMIQLLRVLKIALGRDFLPTSNKDVPEYLHAQMEYKVMNRTPKGAPSCNELSIQKLKLEYPENPILDILLEFRRLSKETGSLKFEPMPSL